MTTNQLPTWPGWKTVQILGQGSFGAVYEIERDMLGETEKAALKVITIPQHPGDIDTLYNEGYDAETVTATFQEHLKSILSEYRLMRKLNGCTNVVNCDDVRYVQHDDGIGWDIFIKMELLTPLAKAFPGQITDDLVIKIGKDLCNALLLCAKHNIIHRDIKPQNIFVSPNGDYKLGDFGIAKIVEQTTGGTKAGTPKYMAPEVYNNQPYGASADVYSLGIVLYWLLNERRLPFLPLPSEQILPGMDEKALRRRMQGETLPPPKHGCAALKKLVLKACAYDSSNRYHTAGEMLADLNALQGIKIELVPTSDQLYDPKNTGKSDDTARAAPKRAPVSEPQNWTHQIKRSTQLCVFAIVVTACLIGLLGYWQAINKSKDVMAQRPTEKFVETVHVHNWKSATCSSPEICQTCGETQGTSIDHQWIPATISAPKQCEVCGITEGSRIFLAGDSLWMGHYEQDGNISNGKEEIEWIVLEYDAEKNQAFVISKYCLDTIPFDFNSATWQDSSIRKWLNNDFINITFSLEERNMLIGRIIDLPIDQSLQENADSIMTDFVFLLDYEEASRNFASNESRQGTPTEYCRQRGCYDPERYAYEHDTECKEIEKGHTWWWLRSEGIDHSRAGNVVSAGVISAYGGIKNSSEGSIRPAMWIKTA